MARTTIRTEDITASAVTSAKIAAGAVDTSGIVANQDDIALLGFKVAANGSLAKYNLVDQAIDAFEDASGVDASASTDETRNTAGYYSGTATTPTTKEFAATDASWAIASGTVINKLIVIGGGGSGASRLPNGTNGYGSGAGGAGWAGAVDYTVGAGITSANVTIGAGGLRTGTTGNTGGTSSIVFGSDFTLQSTGGVHGIENGDKGGGGGGSKSGTSSGSVTTLFLTGGDGGLGTASSGGAGLVGSSGTLDSVSYTGCGGGGGGGGAATGGAGGNGLSSSYSGGGGGGGGDSAGAISGGSGYGTAGSGGYTNGTQNAGSVTIDSVTVLGGAGGVGVGTGADPRPYTNAGGGGMCGGGGGGGGDGIGSGGGSWNAGAGGQGYVRVEYDKIIGRDMTLISNATTAVDGAPTTGDLVITYTDGSGTATVNTDIKAYISRNGSAYTSAVTLVSQGTTGGHTILTANGVDLSGITTGTSMRWKIETLNQGVAKETRIQAVSLGWS